MKLVMKPHGGGSGAAEEIMRCLDKVKHPNFKIWYDAGNIIYYTGKDPLEQLKPIAQYVTGFCAKDCDRQKGERVAGIRQGQGGFSRGVQRIEAGGLQWAGDGRVLRAWKKRGRNDGQCPQEPVVPGEDFQGGVDSSVAGRVAFEFFARHSPGSLIATKNATEATSHRCANTAQRRLEAGNVCALITLAGKEGGRYIGRK